MMALTASNLPVHISNPRAKTRIMANSAKGEAAQ